VGVAGFVLVTPTVCVALLTVGIRAKTGDGMTGDFIVRKPWEMPHTRHAQPVRLRSNR